MIDPALLRGAAVALTALLSGVAGTGCSLGVDGPDGSLREFPDAVTLLEFEAPHEGLVFSTIDDEQRDLPGVALTARVLVRDLENDLWLEDVALQVYGERGTGIVAHAPVHVDREGRRCAEVPFTFFPGDEPQTFTIVATAGTGLQQVARELTVAAAE